MASFTDAFIGTDYSDPSSDWTKDLISGAQAYIINNRLRFIHDDTEVGTSFLDYDFNFSSGDFDIEVDFRTNLTRTDGTWLGGLQLEKATDSTDFLMVRYGWDDALDGGTYKYNGRLVENGSTVSQTNSAKSSNEVTGTIRLTRVGTTFTAYYKDGTSWTTIRSWTSQWTDAIKIRLFFATANAVGGTQDFDFDEIRATEGTASTTTTTTEDIEESTTTTTTEDIEESTTSSTSTTTTEEIIEESIIYADFTEQYTLAPVVADFEEVFRLSGNVYSDFNETYYLTKNVYADFEEKFRLLDRIIVITDFDENFSLRSDEFEDINHTLSVTVDGAAIEVESLNINYEEGSFCMSLDLTLLNVGSFLKCKEGAEVIVVINDMTFYFIIDSTTRSRAFGATKWTASGRSKTSRLDIPEATPITKTWGATTAKTIVQELCSGEGITLDWQILDWPLESGLVEADEESPLSIIKKITGASGAEVQTGFDGSLIVRYLYPLSPSRYSETVADFTLTDEDINSVSENFEKRKGYNVVLISNKEVQDNPEEYLSIELDPIKNNEKSSFQVGDKPIYVRIFSSKEYTPVITSGSMQKIESDHILEVEPETVSFVYNEFPSVSYPIYELVSKEWYGVDLGEISVVENRPTTLEAADQSSSNVAIAKVVYKTKYDIWKIIPPEISTKTFSIFILVAHS